MLTAGESTNIKRDAEDHDFLADAKSFGVDSSRGGKDRAAKGDDKGEHGHHACHPDLPPERPVLRVFGIVGSVEVDNVVLVLFIVLAAMLVKALFFVPGWLVGFFDAFLAFFLGVSVTLFIVLLVYTLV